MLLAVAHDALGGHANLAPEVEGLVVVQVDGGPEAVRGHGEPVLGGHQLPGPGDGLRLEVIADAEVAQHLEEGEVAGVAHRIDVAGAEALLDGGQAAGGRRGAPLEVGLELHHAGAGEEQRRVARGHQGRAGHRPDGLALGRSGGRSRGFAGCPYSNVPPPGAIVTGL